MIYFINLVFFKHNISDVSQFYKILYNFFPKLFLYVSLPKFSTLFPIRFLIVYGVKFYFVQRWWKGLY